MLIAHHQSAEDVFVGGKAAGSNVEMDEGSTKPGDHQYMVDM
jgi:hypothetical protein